MFQNDAVGGATSSSVVSGQLPLVVPLATNHQIDDSTLIIGGNDAVNGGIAIAQGGDPSSFINSYVSNVENVIHSIITADPGVHQVFGNMPDVTVTPLVQSEAKSLGITSAQLKLLSNAIATANV